MVEQRVHAWFVGLSDGEQVEARAAAGEIPVWLANSMAENDITALELVELLRLQR